MRDIGKNLKSLREQKGLRQEELAEQLYVTRQTISNYENGRSRPDIETLMKLAELLGTDINSILYGPPVPENRKAAKRQFAIAAVLTVIFFTLWLLGSYIWTNMGQFLSYNINVGAVYYLSKLFLRPMTLLFLGWTMFHGVSLLCKTKPMSSPQIKYARWLTISITSVCLLSIIPYLDIWIGSFISHSFKIEWNHIDFKILDLLGYEIIILNAEYPWVYFLLGALLWLFGFPQKKEKKVE